MTSRKYPQRKKTDWRGWQSAFNAKAGNQHTLQSPNQERDVEWSKNQNDLRSE